MTVRLVDRTREYRHMGSDLDLNQVLKAGKIPSHVAIIMDGNGRWAQKLNRPRIFGHKSGARRVREIVESACELGLDALTLYAFSKENWLRPQEEVKALFSLLSRYLRSEIESLDKKDIQLRGIGDRSDLPQDCQDLLEKGEAQTKGNTGLKLTLALNYGGRSEIVKCCRDIAKMVAEKKLTLDEINHELVAKKLSTADLPDPDLLIRTSGEQRVSNFLLWEMAYTEFYFTPINWPEFGKQNFLEAIVAFQSRVRRYGRVNDQVPKKPVPTDGEIRC